MELVSGYVREQQRYTKSEIKEIFSLQQDEVIKFINHLKSYGVLKSVKNNAFQKDLSDLIDSDIEIIDENENNNCLYVFTFVGVITCGNRILKIYPKYLKKKNLEPLEEMKEIIKVLDKYNNSEVQIINIYNGQGDNKTFNLLSVILYLLKDYFENGIYTNTEEVIEVNGEGDILWEKTISDSFWKILILCFTNPVSCVQMIL